MSAKIKKKERIDSWDKYDLEGTIPEVIEKLNKVVSANPIHFDFTIDISTDNGYYGECETNVFINAFRWETDEEFEARKLASKMASEAAKLAAKTRAAANEKREKSLYETLKKKFEREINETSPK